MLSMTTDDERGLIEITVDGTITVADFDRVQAELERMFETHKQLNAVEVIRSFSPTFDPALWWRDLTWGFGHIHKFARATVVTDSGWIGPVTRAVSALMPAEVRVFPLAELEAARRWAAERR